MAAPNFDEKGDMILTDNDKFVNKILNGKNAMVEEEFKRALQGVFSVEAKLLDEHYKEACKSNINITSDTGALDDF